MLDYLLFVVGLVAVLLGARWLVSGSTRLASVLRVPPVVIGLTVIGFGTSAPEIVVSGLASAEGHPGLALGNVVGSNIANVGLVLGATALVAPLRPEMSVIRREGPLMLGISVIATALAFTGSIEPWMGICFLIGLGVYIVGSFVVVRGEDEAVVEAMTEYERERGFIGIPHPVTHGALIVVGLVVLVVGARFLVDSAQVIAADFGVPEFVVASTIIAVGTSVPELATGLVAARRGQADLAMGNVIGSNVFNLLGVLGIAAVLGSIPVSDDRIFDFFGMLAFSLAAIVLAKTGSVLNRAEGGVLLTAYGGFTLFLFLA